MAVAARLRRGAPGPHRDAHRRHRHGHGLARRPGRPARLGDHEPPGQGLRASAWQSGLGRARSSRCSHRRRGRPRCAVCSRAPVPSRSTRAATAPRTPNEHMPRFRELPICHGLSVRPGDAVRSRCPAGCRAEGVQSPGAAGCRRQRHPARRLHRHAAQPPRRARSRRSAAISLPNFIGVDGAATVDGLEGRQLAGRRAQEPEHGASVRPRPTGVADVVGRRRRLGARPGAPWRWRRRRARASRDARPGTAAGGARRCSISGTTSPPTAGSTSGRRARPSTRRWPRWPSTVAVPPGESSRHHAAAGMALPEPLQLAAAQPAAGPGRPRRQLLRDPIPRRVGGRRPRSAAARRSARSARPASCARSATARLPPEVKEAALCNLSTLRTQTCFRTADGRFFGFEGSNNHSGCCWGSCTHVWNYEQATPFLFGALAWSMREVEFAHATDDHGLMSFRVHLPLERAQEFGKAAADGQMGCVMKVYRDWQLSGDDAALKSAVAARAALAGVLLDPRRLGRRQGRRDGRRAAQHDGRRVLRPQPADGPVVPRRAQGRRSDGAPRRRHGVCRHVPSTSSPAAAHGSTRTCSTASTTSTRCGRRPAPTPSRRACWSAWAPTTSPSPTTSSAPAAWSISSSASTWRTSSGSATWCSPSG